ncbi:MAG: acetylornithine deacetylase (ArgE) [Chlamydiales bacterium 38-26]|nr:MAG: acetylornithine deacetylase (ArgE) [Chlamydiales bacterium 38-26]
MDKEEWLSRLIAFDTTSCNSNLPLINCVGNWLEQLQIPVSLTYDSTQAKANLFATIPASDGSLNGGLILSGHTDVVPVTGQAWDSNPFCALKTDKRIYGRGACDMKGFLAVVLSLIPEIQSNTRKNPVHIAFSYDEEVGCLGVPLLIADLQQKGIRPSVCIVGEPTEMVPVIAHKGINSFKCRIHGLAAHSSLSPKGCNAVEYGAQLICWLRELAKQFKEKGFKDDCYDVPYTTLTSTMISGGIAINTIPSSLEFLFEFRNLPQDNPAHISQKIKNYVSEYLIPEMQTESVDASVEIEPISCIPAFQSSEEELIEFLGRRDSMKKVSYATEAGLFQKAGIPTIVCGPGSIIEAHKANEFVSLEQLDECEKFLRKVIR